MTQRPTKTMRRKSAPAALHQDLAESPGAGLPGKSFIELITVQWQRERGDLDLSNFLLAIYLMRLTRCGCMYAKAIGTRTACDRAASMTIALELAARIERLYTVER